MPTHHNVIDSLRVPTAVAGPGCSGGGRAPPTAARTVIEAGERALTIDPAPVHETFSQISISDAEACA
jgi:hypothetical protein